MRRASSAKGSVLDEQRNPVAGAVILVRTKDVRLLGRDRASQRRDGSFPLFGVGDGDTIRLSARCAAMATQQATSLVVSPTVVPELILVRQVAVELCGQVVDNSHTPVAGATVTVQKKVVVREEGESPEFSQAEDLLRDGSFVRTDAQGRFRFPATIDWQQTFRIQVARHGYAPFCTPWRDGRQLPVADGRTQLGEYCLLRLPANNADRGVRCRRRHGSGHSRCEGRAPGCANGEGRGDH